MKWYRHLRTINRHKRMVLRYCFRLGLYKQGLLHDMSKYSPTEFLVGAKYFQGTRSPNAAEREEKGYTSAWLHHKGRNKHHMEYWIDYSMNPNEGMVGMEIPVNYVAEMFCDRVAASRNYNLETYDDSFPLNYYLKSKKKYIVHPNTEALLLKMLTMLKDEGEEKTFHYIKHDILKK